MGDFPSSIHNVDISFSSMSNALTGGGGVAYGTVGGGFCGCLL